MLTEEQKRVFDAFCGERKSVAVDAFPGTGKTTTALHCLMHGPWQRALYLTYNRGARDACFARMQALLEQCDSDAPDNDGGPAPAKRPKSSHFVSDIHTFHSAAGKLFNTSTVCSDDVALVQLLESNPTPRVTDIDAVIVDEAQDMRLHFARLVQAVIDKCCAPHVTVLIVGNIPQTVHAYHPAWPATPLFLEHPNTTLVLQKPVAHFRLTHTFRLTQTSARAITALAHSCGRPSIALRSDKPDRFTGQRSVRLAANASRKAQHRSVAVAAMIARDTHLRGASVAVFFNTLKCDAASSLCRTLRNRSPAVHPKLCFTGADVDAARESGAVAVMSFCMAKGLEFDHTYVYAAHNTLWERHRIPHALPNPVFVALTRHAARCTVFWDADKDTPPHFATLFDPTLVSCLPSSHILDNAPDKAAFAQHASHCERPAKPPRTLFLESACDRIDVGCIPSAAHDAQLFCPEPNNGLFTRAAHISNKATRAQDTDLAIAALATVWGRRTTFTEPALRKRVFKATRVRGWRAVVWPAFNKLQTDAPGPPNSGPAAPITPPEAHRRLAAAGEGEGLTAACLPHIHNLTKRSAEHLGAILRSSQTPPPHLPFVKNIATATYKLLKHFSARAFVVTTQSTKLPNGTTLSARVIKATAVDGTDIVATPLPLLGTHDPVARQGCFAVRALAQALGPSVKTLGICATSGRLFEPPPKRHDPCCDIDFVDVLLEASVNTGASATQKWSPQDLRQVVERWRAVYME